MAELSIEDVREHLRLFAGNEVTLAELRAELQIEKGTKAFDALRAIMFRLVEQKEVRRVPGRRARFKVITKVSPIQVFGIKREKKPPFELIFPKDRDSGMEFPFASEIVVREGDCVLISGQSNWGKTTLALNFAAENIDKYPVLMGNEYAKDGDPTPRFLDRLENMDWVEWTNGDGMDKFCLLPVRDDYQDHIVRDKINIIDWINLPGEYYMISPLMEGIKHAIGNGIAIPIIQKNEGTDYGRGGYPTKDFADIELLIDKHTNFESRITIGKVKESRSLVTGRSWAFGIGKGVRIFNVREVVKCPTCHGFKFIKGKGACDTCGAVGWINKEEG